MEMMITLILWGAITAFLGFLTVKYLNPWAKRRRIRKQEQIWEREADVLAWQNQVKTQRLRDRRFM